MNSEWTICVDIIFAADRAAQWERQHHHHTHLIALYWFMYACFAVLKEYYSSCRFSRNVVFFLQEMPNTNRSYAVTREPHSICTIKWILLTFWPREKSAVQRETPLPCINHTCVRFFTFSQRLSPLIPSNSHSRAILLSAAQIENNIL